MQLSVKAKEKGYRYQVQLKLGTRHRKYNLHMVGRDRAESTVFSVQSAVEVIQKIQPCSDSGRVTSEFWGPVGPWLWNYVKIKEEKEECKLHGRHSDCYWVEVRKRAKKTK